MASWYPFQKNLLIVGMVFRAIAGLKPINTMIIPLSLGNKQAMFMWYDSDMMEMIHSMIVRLIFIYADITFHVYVMAQSGDGHVTLIDR